MPTAARQAMGATKPNGPVAPLSLNGASLFPDKTIGALEYFSYLCPQ
jgi:hypothetical protein